MTSQPLPWITGQPATIISHATSTAEWSGWGHTPFRLGIPSQIVLLALIKVLVLARHPPVTAWKTLISLVHISSLRPPSLLPLHLLLAIVLYFPFLLTSAISQPSTSFRKKSFRAVRENLWDLCLKATRDRPSHQRSPQLKTLFWQVKISKGLLATKHSISSK